MINSLKSAILALSVSVLFACNKEAGDSFIVEGNMAGAANQAILIETLNFPNMNGQPLFTTIDTASTDAEGNFRLKGNLMERSIARVKLVQRPENYFLVNVLDENISVQYDLNAQEDPVIEGSTPTLVLNAFIRELRGRNMEIIDFNQQVLSQSEVLGDSLTAVMEQRMDAMIDDYYDFVSGFADTTAEVTNKIVALENLLYEIHFDRIKDVAETILASADSSSTYIKELDNKIERYNMVSKSLEGFVGAAYTDFSLMNPKGEELSLSDLDGKVVLLDFWASWCKPCRDENPNLVKIYNLYHKDGFEIFSVSLDDNKDNWEKAIQNDGLSWSWHVSQIGAEGVTPAEIYSVRAIPASFLIDRNGMIVEQNLRGFELEQAVAELIGK